MRVLILLPVLALSGCASMHTAKDSWSGQDKAQHFIASAVLSAAANEYGQRQQNWGHDRSAAFGFLFSVSLGAGKEFWDSRPGGTGWSWKDFAWDVAGASTGYAVWQLAHH